MDKRFLLVFFVVAAVAVGIVVILLVGSREVERDGVENDSHGLRVPTDRVPFSVRA